MTVADPDTQPSPVVYCRAFIFECLVERIQQHVIAICIIIVKTKYK